MIKKVAIVLGVVVLLAIYVYPTDYDAPLWLHIMSWYIGVAIWFSLTVPIRTGRTLETLKEASPLARVMIGLIWPVYLLVWFTARYLL
jgi:hypothetical protein